MTALSPARVIATICARGGSKGLPGKNLRPFPDAQGAPLIVHTIRHALACTRIQEVYVSTDDEAIADVSREAGARVPLLRPADLATDSASKLPAIEHMVSHAETLGPPVDVVVDLQPTSPLRMSGDIESCMDALADADLALSVYPSGFHPAFNLVEEGRGGRLTLCAAGGGVRRQDLPPVYALNGSIYAWRRAALPQAIRDGVWSLDVRGSMMPRERSADIDDLLDFEWAAWLYLRNQEGRSA